MPPRTSGLTRAPRRRPRPCRVTATRCPSRVAVRLLELRVGDDQRPRCDDRDTTPNPPLCQHAWHPSHAAATRAGLSLVWKIVLVVELIGRPNGVGFVLGSAFSLFDMAKILSYAISFIALMLVIESLLVQPLERRAIRWRRRPA